MQKIGSCGGERFAPATLINQENPEEEEDSRLNNRKLGTAVMNVRNVKFP